MSQQPQSDELTHFYQQYEDWLSAGAPDQAPFSRAQGLCHQVRFFCLAVGYDQMRVAGELMIQFRNAGLSPHYPFNKNGSEFSFERSHCLVHSNPKRIQWVQERVNG